jgi:phosphoribosylformylglycinamidine cyclo-ligase
VTGVAEACQAAGCALLGGETAEMPGVYTEGAFDLAGIVIGLVDRDSLWPRQEEMLAGDLLVGLPSSGPHTNGYSLIRTVVADRDLSQILADEQTLGDALLTPHRCYVAEIEQMIGAGIDIKGLAHITGGGFVDNIPRVLPEHLVAAIDVNSWSTPPIFRTLLEWSGMDEREAYRVFNMGIGMVAIVPAADVDKILTAVPEAVVIGRLGQRDVQGPQVQLIL